MSDFFLRVVTSTRVFFQDRAEVLVVSAADGGEKAYMAHHEEEVMALQPGALRVKRPDGTWVEAAAGAGVLQAANNRVTVLVETAELPEEIDEARARRDRERALEEMRQKQSIREYKQSQATLARALTRLRVKKHGSLNI